MEDSKVDTILEAARRRFAQYGLSKTTMNEIAADIGMSKASLYYYFPDKERLFVAVVEKDMQEFVTAIGQLIDKPSRASFKLKKYITVRNDLFHRLLTLSKIVNASQTYELFNPVFNELKLTMFKREKELIERILHLGVEEKEFKKVSVPAYAELFVSAMIGLRAGGLYIETGDDAARYEKISRQTQMFMDIFLAYLQPDK